MADRKREDFEIEEPDDSLGERESDNLVGRSATQDAGLSLSMSKVTNNGPVSIVAYCFSSISMTVVNKYVVSGDFWNLNFLYLALQVCPDSRDEHQLALTPTGNCLHHHHHRMQEVWPHQEPGSCRS